MANGWLCEQKSGFNWEETQSRACMQKKLLIFLFAIAEQQLLFPVWKIVSKQNKHEPGKEEGEMHEDVREKVEQQQNKCTQS